MTDRENAAGRPAYSAPALTKGLEVLELLAVARSPLTMKEIADGLGRSKNEIFRMLVALQERGYLERDPDTDAFSLTDKLFKLGLHMPTAQDLMTLAMPELSGIARSCAQSPHLIVINQGLTVTTAAVPGGDDMSFTLRLGYGRLVTDSTSGQVILAFLPRPVADRIVTDCERISAEPIDRPALGAQLDRIKAQGYELRESRDFVGITDICCPIFGANGEAVASIIIAYMNRHNRENRHHETLEALRAACGRISGKLSLQVRQP